MGTPASFSAMFSKGDNFMTSCLLPWRMKSSQTWVYSFMNEFALVGANSFLYEMTPIYIGGSNENDRVTFPEYIFTHFNIFGHILLQERICSL